MNTRRPFRLTALFIDFFNSERSSGALLLLAMFAALLAANGPAQHAIAALLEARLRLPLPGLDLALIEWINEGLMAIFFVQIGLEIEREVYSGELSNLRNALLPLLAALGGMVAPALIHLALNMGTPTQMGFGIPMATDIAIALGVLGLLGNRVPPAAKVFLAALAIADDIGAMIVIALGYSRGVSLPFLALALLMFGVMGLLNFRKVHQMRYYVLPGLLLWYFMLRSGVHTSIAGVMFAFALPYADGSEASPSYQLEHALNRPVAWVVMPIFAFANSGIVFSQALLPHLFTRNTLGIAAGLLLGKPLGIISFSLLAIRQGWASLPQSLRKRHLLGLGFLGGIGFTMSTFITVLAFGNSQVADASKIAILAASAAAGLAGFVLLLRRKPMLPRRKRHKQA